MKPIYKKLMPFLVFGAVLAGGALAVSLAVRFQGSRYIVDAADAPAAQTAIVLGAYVHPDGALSAMLEDRVKTGVDLYKAGKVKKLLMTGDHGQDDYDEVNSMRERAEALGVPAEDIFMDHAGFNTYESMVRARKVFQVQSAIVVTQDFHLPRSVYLARSQGIDAHGVSADRRPYLDAGYYELRDTAARCKAFVMVNVTRPDPTFLGPIIPITGDGRNTRG